MKIPAPLVGEGGSTKSSPERGMANARAKTLRSKMTTAERKLWYLLALIDSTAQNSSVRR
jgi:very-short-patch-repair endonuclease